MKEEDELKNRFKKESQRVENEKNLSQKESKELVTILTKDSSSKKVNTIRDIKNKITSTTNKSLLPSSSEIMSAAIEAGQPELASDLEELVRKTFEKLQAEEVRVAEMASNQTQEPITSATEYFNRKETQQVKETLKDIELDKPVSQDRLIETVENLDSEKETLLRKETIEKLEEEKKRYFKELVQSRKEIDEHGIKYVQQIDKQLDELYKHDDAATLVANRIGPQRNKEERAEAVKKHEPGLRADLREYLVNGPKQRIQKLERATQDLCEVTKDNVVRGGTEVAQNLTKVEEVLIGVKKEIKQDSIDVISKISEEKASSKKENDIDQSLKDSVLTDNASKEKALRIARAMKKGKKKEDSVIKHVNNVDPIIPNAKKLEQNLNQSYRR